MGQEFTSKKGPEISITTTEMSEDPRLKYDSACDGNTACNTTQRKVVWNNGNNQETANSNGATTWTAKTTDSGDGDSKTVDRIDLFFNGDAASQIWVLDIDNETSSAKGNNTDNYVVVKGGKDASAIKADFKESSLGTKDDRINLYINFSDTDNKTITVNSLNELYGDLYISSTGRMGTDSNTYTMNVNKIHGNINVRGRNNGFTGTVKINELLQGNIQTNSASLQGGTTPSLRVEFQENAKMIGSIKGIESAGDGIKREVIFKGSGDVLTGNIISFGTSNGNDRIGFYKDAGNFVTFEKGSMKGSIIASGSKPNTITYRGQNVVTFGKNDDTPTTHTIEGGILAELISSASWSNNNGAPDTLAKNIINVEKKNTLNITGSGIDNSIEDKASNGNGDKFSVPKGGITARGFASNEINLKEGSTINLNNGEGIMDTSLDHKNKGYGGPHTQSILTFKGKDGTFNGKILSDGINIFSNNNNGFTPTLTTYIKVDSNASGTITNDITQNNGGKNMIELGTVSTGAVSASVSSESSAMSQPAATLTLQGATNQIEQVKANAQSTLFIDGSKHNGNNTSINGIDNTSNNGQNLTLLIIPLIHH